MEKSSHSDEQIIGFLKQAEAGAPIKGVEPPRSQRVGVLNPVMATISD